MRVNELIAHLEEDIEILVNDWQCTNENETNNELNEFWYDITKNIGAAEKIVISFLRSSAITNSHKFRIAGYVDEIFVETPIFETFVSFKNSVNKGLGQTDDLYKKLAPTFIQITNYEKEEIRRYYTTQLYKVCSKKFRDVLISQNDTNSPLKIYFGEEMGELNEIGEI